jgi:cell shape-determining protein MreD
MSLRTRYLWNKAAAWIAAAIPISSTLAILALSFVDTPVLAAKPMLALVPIFFWASVENRHIDFVSIMAFGFVQDFMDGTQPGVNIFVFLTLYFIAYYQKLFPLEDSFLFSWLTFGGLSAALYFVKYQMISIFVPNISAAGALYSWLALVVAFAPICLILEYFQFRFIRKYGK